MRLRVALIVAIVGVTAAGIAVATAGTPARHPSMGAMVGPHPGMAGAMPVTSEFAYLAEMIPHHEEAIAAARRLQARTERARMREFAAEIVRTQSAELEQMHAWLADWYPDRDASVTEHRMMRDFGGLRGAALDRPFLQDMIPHHAMAVMMSQHLLAGGLVEHDAVTPFVRGIRDVQRAEIRMMRSWLRSWFGVAGRPCGGMGMHRRVA